MKPLDILSLIVVILLYSTVIGAGFLIRVFEAGYGHGWIFKILWLLLIVVLSYWLARVYAPWLKRRNKN